MKPFDLEAAKKGAKVCTSVGWPARILTFNLKDEDSPIAVAVSSRKNYEEVYSVSEQGVLLGSISDMHTIMMADDDYLDKLERGEYGTPAWQGPHRIMTPKQIAVQTFPSIADEWYWRKMYAGMAMYGFMADYEYKKDVCAAVLGLEKQIRRVAEMAVIAADALIDELKKEKK